MKVRPFIIGFFVVCLSHAATSAYAAGVPVFDGVAEAHNLKQWQENLVRWLETKSYHDLNNRLAQNSLSSLSGIKNVGGMNYSQLYTNLAGFDLASPDFNSIINGNWDSSIELVAEQLDIDSLCTNTRSDKLKRICRAEILNTAALYQANATAKDAVKQVMDNVDKLIKISLGSSDVKESSDVNNLIATVNNQVSVIDRKLAIAESQYNKNKDFINSQREIAIREINRQPSTRFFQSLSSRLRNGNTTDPDGWE